ncbi:hypothetical protein [Isoptericola sp. NPDC019482]|uniref:hypothetical protein n=1 Tax=Isoptericola sp. NPDC019482 TaxID=3154688 RepID=UPI00348603A0
MQQVLWRAKQPFDIPPHPQFHLRDAVLDAATRSVLAWEEHLAADTSSAWSAFAGWVDLLALRLIDDDHYDEELLDRVDAAAGPAVSFALQLMRSGRLVRPSRRSPLSIREVAAHRRVRTAPAGPQPGLPTAVARLAEAHTLAVTDRRFWDRPITAVVLAPVLLVDLLRSGPSTEALDVESSIMAAYARLQAHQLFARLPWAAEQALDRYIDIRTEANGRTQPPPSARATAQA